MCVYMLCLGYAGDLICMDIQKQHLVRSDYEHARTAHTNCQLSVETYKLLALAEAITERPFLRCGTSNFPCVAVKSSL